MEQKTRTPFPTATFIPPTVSPQPTPTPTSTLSPTATEQIYVPPAARFLPGLQDFDPEYALDTNIAFDNLLLMANLPVPKDNVAAITFRNQGSQRSSDPQNGLYYQFSYWVVLAPDEANARLFYAMSTGKDYSKQAFLVIMPAAVFQTIGDINPIPFELIPCDQVSILGTVSDPYAVYRSGKLPTQNPLTKGISGGISPQEAVRVPPDLYVYASCQVKNALVLFWGHAPDNYDGKNAPIPDKVIAAQVNNFLQIAITKLSR
ncbi:MAG TPA: hypothetical protein VKF38_06480 [Anaerolineaceae bacterium]|nr:hypothetical protein [Anaerolineaceae bacterium]